MTNKFVICCIFCFYFHTLQAQNVSKLSFEESRNSMINMGIQNSPEFFFDHYYRYPESISELCSFLENHYDYIESDELWGAVLSYLREKENNIRVASQKDLFIVSQGSFLSYNKCDVCAILALHSPMDKYVMRINEINLYNSSGRNLREIIGTNNIDSITDIFREMKRNVYLSDTIVYRLEENNLVKYDKYRRVLLEYDVTKGLDTFCSEESLILSEYPFFKKIEGICRRFCEEQKVNRIMFCSLVFKAYDNKESLESLRVFD